MVTSYDLWDVDTGNNLGHFEREEEALKVVCALTDRYGDAYADDLQLGGQDDQGNPRKPLTGRLLLDRARKLAAAYR
jgi:hypothetical protein